MGVLTTAMLIVGAVVVAVWLLMMFRGNEIFCVSVRDGRCLIIRGHVPPSLWRELRDVMGRARVRRGTVRAIKSDGRPRLVFRGVDPGTQQRLRNAFGAQGFGHLKASAANRAGQRDGQRGGGSRNIGQLLGFAWLAWLLAGRR